MTITKTDRQANWVAGRNTIERLQCADPKRRKRLEKRGNEKDWLKFYLAETYPRPFERPHEEMISGIIAADENNSRFAEALERGIGKSVVGWGMTLYLKFTGRRKFPACVPWADKALKRAFKFWKNAVCFNPRLLADYPEFCQPFAHARGVAQRVPNVCYEGEGKPTGAQLAVGDGILVFPSGLGCIGGATINGNIRGLNHPQEDGTVLRPDFVFLDDVQDRETAKSPIQVLDTIAIIDGDVAGCGDAGKDLAMVMACNCIDPNDVPAHYLKNSEWRALRVPCIESWPDGWDDLASAARAAWDEWAEVWRCGGDDVAFYKEHREVMTAGMKLSAPAAFKGSEKCPDAFYGVIRMYFRMGHDAFMAERQQAPVDPVASAGPYTLTPAIIQSRSDKRRKMLERPEWVTRVLASTDINPSHALTTVVVGFGEDQSAAVLWYGLHKLSIPGNTPAPMLARMLFDQLTIHGKALAGLPTLPEAWAIDGGGAQFDPVVRFAEMAARLVGIPAHAFTGRGSKNYRTNGKTVSGALREQCHGALDRKNGRIIRWVPWNADYWKEVAQRAWLGEIDSPGAVSLFAGIHGEFAAQVCGDKLMGKGEIGGQMIWNYHRVPGRNDFGDAMAQAYALAAYGGIGTGGRSVRGERRKIRAVISNQISKENEKPKGNDDAKATTEQPQQAWTGRPKRRAVIGRRG